MVQLMDVETQHTLVQPRTGDVEHVQAFTTKDETIGVLPSVDEVEVINWSDVESCNFKRHLLGDSTNGDSDDDDVGINNDVPLSAAVEPLLPMTDPSTRACPALALDFVPTASTNAALSSTPSVDKFYNAAGKAPHPKAIIPKESG